MTLRKIEGTVSSLEAQIIIFAENNNNNNNNLFQT